MDTERDQPGRLRSRAYVHLGQVHWLMDQGASHQGCRGSAIVRRSGALVGAVGTSGTPVSFWPICGGFAHGRLADRKSTRLNSSHVAISYAVLCLKQKT